MSTASVPVVHKRWREDPPTRTLPGRSTVRVRRIRFLSVLAVGLCGALAGMIAWWKSPPSPYFVPFWITEFRERALPINEAAAQDRAAIQRAAVFPRVSKSASAARDRHSIQEALASLRDRAVSESVVVYLCTYATTGEQGELMLLPADASLDDSHTWLRMSEVLQYIKECPARHKLLILDICWPIADPRLGILSDDLAGRLADELRQVDDPPRLVLCSCAPGQVAASSEELRRSVFGFYVEHGLCGAADGAGAGAVVDGRVSVKELAAFVATRVDQWCQHHGGRRQSPQLIGAGGDFELAAARSMDPPKLAPQLPSPAISTSSTTPHATASPAAASAKVDKSTPQPLARSAPVSKPGTQRVYPQWLISGWQLRDSWQSEQVDRVAPQIMRQLESMLLRAECRWRFGGDVARLDKGFAEQLATLQRRRGAFQSAVAGAEPHSLAQAARHRMRADAEVGNALNAWLLKLTSTIAALPVDKQAAAVDAAIREFLEKSPAKAYYDLASAAWLAAVNDVDAQPQQLRWLARLLERAQANPQYAEIWFLRSCANLADDPLAPWDVGTARLAIRTVDATERAAAAEAFFPRLHPLLEAAANSRHEAETQFLQPGFAPATEALQSYQASLAACDQILSIQQTLDRAVDVRNAALRVLPAYLAYLEHAPNLTTNWQQALEAASQLCELLARETAIEPTATPQVSQPAVIAESLLRLQAIGQQTTIVESSLADLLRPFGHDRVARLSQEGQQPDAGAVLRAQAEALLSVPFLAAGDRVIVWQTVSAIGKRLDQQIHQLEQHVHSDGQQAAFTRRDYQNWTTCADSRSSLSAGQFAMPSELGTQAKQRARHTELVLRLAGLQQPERSDAEQLTGMTVRWLWSQELPRQLRDTRDLDRADRLSRVFPARFNSPLLDDASTNPTLRRIRDDQQRWMAWIADRYRYLARDACDVDFYEQAADDLARHVTLPAEVYPEMNAPDELQISPENPAVEFGVNWRVVAGGTNPPQASIRVLNPAPDRLHVMRVDRKRTSDLTARYRVSLLPNGDASAGSPAQGITVQTQLGQRRFHRRIPIPALALADQFQIRFSPNPNKPEPSVTQLRLRPTLDAQALYLFVRSLAVRPTPVLLELTSDRTITQPLTLQPGVWQRVQWEAAGSRVAPTETQSTASTAMQSRQTNATWPELTNPLRVRLLSQSNQQVLAAQGLSVEVASPRDYVRVSNVRFDPNNCQQNRLSLRLQGLNIPAGPPCVADLVVTPDRVPGLLGIQGGSLRGIVPDASGSLWLIAENLKLDPSASEDGEFALTIDGCPRAFVFATTFARNGDPTTPREVCVPAMRLNAPPTAIAGPGFPIVVEVDQGPADATLEVAIGRDLAGTFVCDQTRTLHAARQHRVGCLLAGPGGAMQLAASINDWKLDFDATGLPGQRWIRARLLGRDGMEKLVVRQPVLFDDTPPNDARFINLPAQAGGAEPLAFQVAGQDSLSGIREVLVFIGKPVHEQIPANVQATPALPVYGANLVFAGKLPLPKGLTGPATVSAQLTNGVGLKSFISAPIELFETEPIVHGTISGTVFEGPRPQAGLMVQLCEPSGAVRTEVKTQTDGSFELKAIAPGQYKLHCEKTSSKRKGSADANIQAGQTVRVKIELFL